MNKPPSIAIFVLIASAFFVACSPAKKVATTYVPDDQNLYDTIVKLDSLFFETYNNCNLRLADYADFYADTIEFYHDKGGLMTSKKEIVDGTQRNICGKVTRDLVKGSIEIYPIKDYGAIEIGYHVFINHAEKNSGASRPGRFVIFWHQTNIGWKISKVVSLH